jgi:hypothetical protein
MIDDAGKGADEELAGKLEEAYTAEGLGDVVDELYELQKENSEIAAMYSGNLDVGLLTEDQIDGMSDLSSSAKQALKNQVKVIEQGRKDIDLELQKIYNNDNLEAMAFAGGYEQAKKFLDTYNNMLSGAGGELAKSFRNMFAGLD